MPVWRRTASPICCADRVDRIERGHRLLEDHRRPGRRAGRASCRAGIASTSSPQTRTCAVDLRAARRQQPHQRAQGHAFAGAGLAEDAQHLAGLHREADAVDRVHGRLAADKTHAEIADLGERFDAAVGRAVRPLCQLRPRPRRLWPECGSSMWQAATCAALPGRTHRAPARPRRRPPRRTGSACGSGSPRAGRSGSADRR